VSQGFAVRRFSAGTGCAELEQDRADGITTSCGFLSIYRRKRAAHCRVPADASALMHILFVEPAVAASKTGRPPDLLGSEEVESVENREPRSLGRPWFRAAISDPIAPGRPDDRSYGAAFSGYS
jgi:hypothetical protein